MRPGSASSSAPACARHSFGLRITPPPSLLWPSHHPPSFPPLRFGLGAHLSYGLCAPSALVCLWRAQCSRLAFVPQCSRLAFVLPVLSSGLGAPSAHVLRPVLSSGLCVPSALVLPCPVLVPHPALSSFLCAPCLAMSHKVLFALGAQCSCLAHSVLSHRTQCSHWRTQCSRLAALALTLVRSHSSLLSPWCSHLGALASSCCHSTAHAVRVLCLFHSPIPASSARPFQPLPLALFHSTASSTRPFQSTAYTRAPCTCHFHSPIPIDCSRVLLSPRQQQRFTRFHRRGSLHWRG